jgi:translocator protein
MAEQGPPTWAKPAFVTVPAIVIAGSVIGLVTNGRGSNPWYAALAKPSFIPPPLAFPIAWTILYALMGVALAMVLAEPASPRRRFALILFAIQLALNFAWSPIFFAAHDISLAKIVIFLMAAIAAAAAGQFFRLRKAAGYLMLPYLAWLVFASTLTATIETLNPGAGTPLLG